MKIRHWSSMVSQFGAQASPSVGKSVWGEMVAPCKASGSTRGGFAGNRILQSALSRS